ncbi:hypothetical protein ILUMI_11554 [Ignelater luminosus]|uniref:Uncharacterized protein n=1 Tax=Ignelater luminosus TaxID=2038154 RepID=A0A8K0CVV1_IGNLU|nr:hypothetical protein ILUMI_11554 [Ignelater luminosus]
MAKRKADQIDRQKLKEDQEKFQQKIISNIHTLKEVIAITIDQQNNQTIEVIQKAAKPYKATSKRTEKLSDKAKELLARRGELITENKRQTVEYAKINKTIRKMAKENIKQHNTRTAQSILVENKARKSSEEIQDQKK